MYERRTLNTCSRVTFAGIGCGRWRSEMIANVPFQDLQHQAIDSSPDGGNLLECGSAIRLAVEGSFQRFGLPLDPADAHQQLRFLANGMGHR